ncbi:MAG: Holliday junction branch migration protein RuvA [Propionibacteriaceae bacterium]|jgi:Holliday junction DNA helicase RuvA|nr:Holliday junction branch migration protein RuvA [Propionibacteriaceae bacterium]
MISLVRGIVVEARPTSAIVDVQGVGFSLWCTPTTTAKMRVGEETTLHTHLAVREDALTLYGFSTSEERQAFQLVQSVTGIGPKIALATVASLTPGQLRQAVLTENLVTLSTIPGVGKKVAQRLVIELKDKVQGLSDSPFDDMGATGSSPYAEQVIDGLVGLGYSTKDADKAWAGVAEHADDPDITVAQLMKSALRSLARL